MDIVETKMMQEAKIQKKISFAGSVQKHLREFVYEGIWCCDDIYSACRSSRS